MSAAGDMPQEWYADVPRSVTRHVVFGFALMAIAFGGFGWWAFNAPLAAAVIAQGSFVATGRNKIIQHLEGGIIKEILVKEGDTVQAEQVILALDETVALATERELFLRQVRLEATEVRILAALNPRERLVFPPALLEKRGDFEVATILDGQSNAFKVAVQGLNNDIALLERNIEALRIRSMGYERQLISMRLQTSILSEDLADKSTLLERGLMRKSEVNIVRRALAEAEGQVARLDSEITEIAEISRRYETQIEQTLSAHRQAAVDELQVVQSELDSVREKSRKAASVLKRAEIKSPVSGTVIRLYYHTAGGVIESGRAIAEILPSDEPLIIETQIARTEIENVTIGQQATVRLVGLNQRTTPVLNGLVYYVSADAITDKSAEGAREVYVARVSISVEELMRVQGFTPTPGMPAEVLIQTAERSFIDYLVKPISDSMNRAFREQ
jgi:membrane fusion protein, type I secretion system